MRNEGSGCVICIVCLLIARQAHRLTAWCSVWWEEQSVYMSSWTVQKACIYKLRFFILFFFPHDKVRLCKFLYTGIYCTSVSSQTLQAVVVALASVHSIEEDKLLSYLVHNCVYVLEILFKKQFSFFCYCF